MTPLGRLTRKGLTLSLVSEPEQDGDGWFYPVSSTGAGTNFTGTRENLDGSFDSCVSGAYKSNGIVFACILARMLPFSEARFQYQSLDNGRPGRLDGGSALSLLETPWPNGTTGELLSRMEQDASLAGNFYATVVGEGPTRRLRRLRPDWVTIVSGIKGDESRSSYELDSQVLGYIYTPGGQADNGVFLTTEKVAHYSPIPDPDAQWRGMSWLTPVVREIQADGYATRHKLRFFENGATLNVVVSYDQSIPPPVFERFVELFNDAHQGGANAYKTLHLGGGADATVVGTDLKQIDFKAVQGAGETRIAAAAGVGAIIARFSEGLAGSSLNAGNYAAAKRQFADMTLRPLWRTAAASLAKFVQPPAGTRLWYDSRDVEFLKEDRKDAAEILATTAATMSTLVQAGYTPDSVVTAIDTDDLTRLVHSGLYSVQLRSAGEDGLSPLTLPQQIESVGQLVRAGFEPAAALAALGLPAIPHTGLVPVTVTAP